MLGQELWMLFIEMTDASLFIDVGVCTNLQAQEVIGTAHIFICFLNFYVFSSTQAGLDDLCPS